MATNALGDEVTDTAQPRVNAMGDPISESSAGPGRGVSTPPETQPGPIENAMSHAGDRLSELPGALGNAVIHPIDTVKGMYGQQKQLAGEGVDAAKSGDYPLAAARGIETLMPGVGPSIANGFKTIKSGDTSGGVGDMIGSVGPALALRAASMSPKVQAFAKGAAGAATEPTSAHFGPFRVSVPVPAPIAGGVTGSYVGGHFGMPGVGATIGTVAPLIRGGMKAAAGEDWLPSAPETVPSGASFVVPSGRLLNAGGRTMPGDVASDSSYVRGAPAMANPPNAARAIAAPSRIIEMPGRGPEPDASYVHGFPAMTQPPNAARALAAGSAPLVTPSPADASFVRGVPGEYPAKVINGEVSVAPAPVQSQSADAAPAPVEAPAKQSNPRSSGSFDKQGRRIDRNGNLVHPNLYKAGK